MDKTFPMLDYSLFSLKILQVVIEIVEMQEMFCFLLVDISGLGAL
jgi:hypothetical protein